MQNIFQNNDRFTALKYCPCLLDKSLKSYVADDDAIYTSVGSGISEITKVSDDINAIYDEPEEAVM